MSFRPERLNGGTAPDGPGGVVDYRLARSALVSEFRKGRIPQHDVCDAHPELMRAARQVSAPTTMDCPICEDDKLVLVTYVFGPRLPSHGRCITSRRELTKIAARKGSFTGYVVEVCPACAWNHLARAFPLGQT